jgi:hypothetical protein
MRTRIGIVGAMAVVLAMEGGALAKSSSTEPERVGVVDAAIESLTGDVYAQPSRWRPLSLGTFFSEGWDQAWASPINGSGGAPRQGWIGAADGVFYRLGIGTFSYAHNAGDNGDAYNGGVTFYTPLSRRFELRYDLPIIVSSKGSTDSYHTAAGDLAITPRVILSESQDLTQSIGVAFRAPTGDDINGNGIAAITPGYEFWSNPWDKLVVRGGATMAIPFGHDSFSESGARNTFGAQLAAGYYFTDHDMTPFGDLVFDVGTTLTQATDDRGPATTTLLITPAFRTHMGANWYLLAGIDVPVTNPEPYDFQPTVGLMKVF